MNKTKILLVENEKIVARDIEDMLTGLGYEVLEVLSSGKEAVEKAKKLHPDLVLMDVRLQGDEDGVEAADIIYRSSNIPVVYLTAYADRTTMERAKLTEPFGYLLKPFDKRELQTSIEIALHKYKMEMRLKEREKWLFTILKSIGDAVITTDHKGLITFMNPLAEKLTGWKLRNAHHKPLNQTFQTKRENSGHPLQISVPKMVKEKRFSLPHDLILMTRKGEKTPIDCRLSPISDGRGKASGIVLSFTDVRGRKNTEKELQLSWKKLKDVMQTTVQAIASTIEKRDPYTAGHQRRVTKLACAIAEEMGLSEDQIEGLRMAGELHDIGKISVPVEILSKPGKISEEEHNVIKTHTKVGYEILKNIEFPWPIAQIVLQHHERIDGSGYPLGLQGKQMLLEARILAVADVVEAMASHRPYHPAHPIEKALEEISDNKGKLYDSKVVEACLKVFKEKNFSFE
ncbi:MAG: HD domain-containing phosphohydrolase [Candidatus Aminicenantes bacterium]